MDPTVSIYVPGRGTGYGRWYDPRVEDVEWTDIVAGCDEASFTVLDPITTAALTEDCPVVLSDPRSGAPVWTGNVARNGLKYTAFGDSAVVRCTGNVDDTTSSYWSLPYRVDDYSEWGRETIKHRTGRIWKTGTTARPADPPWDAVLMSIDESEPIYPGMGGRMAYMGHLHSDMYVGGITGYFDAGTAQYPDAGGGTPSGLWTRLEVGDFFWGKIPYDKTWSTTTEIVARHATATDWPAPPDIRSNPPRGNADNYLVLATYWNGGAGVTTGRDLWWAASQLIVTGQRVDRFGANVYPTDVTDRMSITQMTAEDIVEDLVGRCLRGVIDPNLLTIDHTSDWNINQLDYRDPTSPGEVLDDLRLFHPDHLWRVGLRSPTSGLAGLEWRPWADDSPRYVIDCNRNGVEVDMDGSPDPLFNRVTLQWLDWRKRPRSTSFDADPAQYPDISSLQGVNEAPPINLASSLGDNEINTFSNVTRIGEKVLSQHARRFPAGTVAVHRPVLDLVNQVMVAPGELEAGQTCILAGTDYEESFRIQEVRHRGMGEAELAVGRPRLDIDALVVRRGHGRK